MESHKLFAGSRLRRFRQERGETQARMASRLGVSASYLTLMETEQRPISAKVLMQLVTEYDLDPKSFVGSINALGQARLISLARDPALADLQLGEADFRLLASRQPDIAIAMLRLAGSEDHREKAASASESIAKSDPVLAADSHFRMLSQSEEFAGDAFRRLSDLISPSALRDGAELNDLMAKLFDVSVTIMPTAVLADILYRYDQHKRRLVFAEAVPVAVRRIVVLRQIVLMAANDWLSRQVEKIPGLSRPAARLLRRRCAATLGIRLALREVSAQEWARVHSLDDAAILSARYDVPVHQLCLAFAFRDRQRREGAPTFVVLSNAGGVVQQSEGRGPFSLARGDVVPVQSIALDRYPKSMRDLSGQIWRASAIELFEPHLGCGHSRRLFLFTAQTTHSATQGQECARPDILRARVDALFPPGYDDRWRFEENSLHRMAADRGLA
jgi:XRE family transcriptional regulator, fatty acid utilization regulator